MSSTKLIFIFHAEMQLAVLKRGIKPYEHDLYSQ